MKPLKYIFVIFLNLSLFTNCSSAQKLQTNAPVTFGEVESQSWVAGVKGGGSGVNLFIPVLEKLPQNIQLDSVYFRGKVAKLELLNGQTTLYVGRFKSEFNQKDGGIIESDKPLANSDQTTEIDRNIPFDLKDSECVISYKKGSETQYFKIENVVEKQPEHYPNAPPNRQ